ncbi:HNH endonuclease [Brevibacterium sp. R8603A2]|uniref:HNH endonuclease signature motif containing protein n=1 Tax=Brevibacterium sp. R8603A2 TaxID=2929779 RepID=UPI001FFA2572|nr:HNH endonuclease signature motif containing protein [Brevibacterium sp. R8603A2]MCK1802539.1 HNH endonuclease [Brevibacterium sp. R8603A2]
MTAPTVHPDSTDPGDPDPRDPAGHPFGERPALIRLRDSVAAHDRVMLARMQLIADTIIEECLDLTPTPDCTTCTGTGCPGCGRDRYGLPADGSLAHWVLERVTGEHLTCLAAVLDTTITRAYTAAREALIATFSLRACHDRATTGILRYERLQYAARRAHRLGDEKLAALDAGITALRPDLSWEAYCRAVNELIRMLTDDEEQEEQVRENRRVDFWRSDAREGRLLLTGPLEPLHALHRRLEATARAIRAAHASTFGEQLPAGAQIADDRTIPQLMFDLLTATAPSTHVEITTPNDTAGSDDACSQDAGAFTAEGSTADPNPGLFPSTGDTDAGEAGPDGRVRQHVTVTCPSNQDWLRRQATVVITVPFLTLTGHATLPGTWSDGTPIPADLARRLAAGSEKFIRILTDPTTGAICPEIAQSYTLPAGMRTTLNQTWAWCTAPGCTRRAETSEADHITPFDHAAPARGGRTDFDNLHPLCKQHHQMKTERILRLHRTADGLICWQFAHGITHTTTPADRPADREAARITRRLLGLTNPDKPDPPRSTSQERPPDGPSTGTPDDPDDDPPDRPDGGPPRDPDDGPPDREPDGTASRSSRASVVIDPWECWEKAPQSDIDDTESADPWPDSTRPQPAASVDSTTANSRNSDRLAHTGVATDCQPDRRNSGAAHAEPGSGATVLGVSVSGGSVTGRSASADRSAGGSVMRTPAVERLANDTDTGSAGEASTGPPAGGSDPWWHADDDPPPF